MSATGEFAYILKYIIHYLPENTAHYGPTKQVWQAVYYVSWKLNRAGKCTTHLIGQFFRLQTAKSTTHSTHYA